jgi:DNA polymerase III alpha subunit
MLIPLFKSDYSFGSSILTLEFEEKDDLFGPKFDPNAANSVFQIAKEAGLDEVVLIDDNLTGFPLARKSAKKIGKKLIFGLRLSMRNSTDDKDKQSDHKVIVFAVNDDGYRLLVKIFSKAFTEHKGFLTYSELQSFWDETKVRLFIPFYDSFLWNNNTSFSDCIPDLNFSKPVFFIEDNGLPLDYVIGAAVREFCGEKYPIVAAKSILYKEKKDFLALQAYKLSCFKSFGKSSNLEKPNLEHFGSDEFCYESWKEKR